MKTLLLCAIALSLGMWLMGILDAPAQKRAMKFVVVFLNLLAVAPGVLFTSFGLYLLVTSPWKEMGVSIGLLLVGVLWLVAVGDAWRRAWREHQHEKWLKENAADYEKELAD